ncbi:MAG: hypothetical protein ACI4NM_04085 [Bullifex sp.]
MESEFRKEVKELLSLWCSSLLDLQIHSSDRRLDGALMCPVCGRIHGRCSDAMYPFMEMARLTGDDKWVRASEKLFEWSENTVSLPCGGYINDIDSDWKGTTVFTLIAMMDVLEHYGTLLHDDFRNRLHERSLKAAWYIHDSEWLKNKNTNYPVTAALALYRAGKLFSEERFTKKSREYEEVIYSVFTESGLVFGEGRDRDMKSPKGLYAIDIGYNAEETLASIAMLGHEKNDERLISLAVEGYRSILRFFLADGAWDNSFGTRNFKWTYWGSRTSDGAAEALLLLSEHDKTFSAAAVRNIELMKRSTSSGLLAGGPDYEKAGQGPCIHHSFTHAKVLAGILRRGLDAENAGSREELVRYSEHGLRKIPDADSYIFSNDTYSATVTGYDWPYMNGGHASGGVMSLLEAEGYGPILTACMGRYYLKEKNNMQVPYGAIHHECPDMRVEKDGFSNRYCGSVMLGQDGENTITAKGVLTDENGMPCEPSVPYSIRYAFSADRIRVKAVCYGNFIVPLAAGSAVMEKSGDEVKLSENGVTVTLRRTDGGTIVLPYGDELMFSLSPGLQYLKTVLEPDEDGITEFEIVIKRGESDGREKT